MHYLDNAATTRPFPSIIEFVQQCLTTQFGNPSSIHPAGVKANQIINESRKTLAGIFDVPLAGVIFCSSGTESDNLALKGLVNNQSDANTSLVTSKLEHAAIFNTAEWLEQCGIQVKYVDIDSSSGRIDLQHLATIIGPDTRLVSIQHVNSETGIIQDLPEISRIVKSRNPSAIVHSDGVQAFSKIPVNLKQMGVDLYSISAHKFHGIKGAAALICARDTPLTALIHGGGQEFGLRSGTENVAAIAAMGQAAKITFENLQVNLKEISAFSNWFKERLGEELEAVRIFDSPHLVPHIISISVLGVPGELLLNHLANNGIFVGLGSACSSSSNKFSETLKALKFGHQQIKETIRISLAAHELPSDRKLFLRSFVDSIKELLD
jgi:cysteine desulfurase